MRQHNRTRGIAHPGDKLAPVIGWADDDAEPWGYTAHDDGFTHEGVSDEVDAGWFASLARRIFVASLLRRRVGERHCSGWLLAADERDASTVQHRSDSKSKRLGGTELARTGPRRLFIFS